MSGQVLGLGPHDLAQPVPHFRAVHRVVVDPLLVAGVVRRVDVDALDLPRVVRQKGLEGPGTPPSATEIELLERLTALTESGHIAKDEFELIKRHILSGHRRRDGPETSKGLMRMPKNKEEK